MTEEDREIMTGCLATLQTLRVNCVPTINIRHLEIVIHIFLNPGITRQELTEQVPELSESSLRRYIKELTNVSWRDSYGGAIDTPNHNLIRIEDSNTDMRFKHLYLTDSGMAMMNTVAKKLQDSMSCLDISPKLTQVTTKDMH